MRAERVCDVATYGTNLIPILTMHCALSVCDFPAHGYLQVENMLEHSPDDRVNVCTLLQALLMTKLILQSQGLTPLMVAASKGNAKIARLLLKHNADFTAKGPKVWFLTTCL